MKAFQVLLKACEVEKGGRAVRGEAVEVFLAFWRGMDELMLRQVGARREALHALVAVVLFGALVHAQVAPQV